MQLDPKAKKRVEQQQFVPYLRQATRGDGAILTHQKDSMNQGIVVTTILYSTGLCNQAI